MFSLAPLSTSPADSLDDFRVPEEFAFYARVTAALEFLLRGSSTPERVFRLYDLTEDDLRRFYRTYPKDTVKFKAAYEAAFLFALLTPFNPYFCLGNALANGAHLYSKCVPFSSARPCARP